MRTALDGENKSLFHPSFLLACAVLGAAAFGVSPLIFAHGDAFNKDPLPLRRPLVRLDKGRLGPYRFMHQSILAPAVEETLAADEYINWQFQDTSVTDERDPLRYVQLFVTYNTGGRDLVPHFPDLCLLGSGYRPIEANNQEMMIESVAQSVPVRVLTAEKSLIWGAEARPTVIYTFHCNGDFVCTRTDVRRRVNSLFERYAYFCKIEVTFGSMESHPNDATRKASIEGAQKFLSYVLPLLVEEHLPDWEAARQASQTSVAAAS